MRGNQVVALRRALLYVILTASLLSACNPQDSPPDQQNSNDNQGQPVRQKQTQTPEEVEPQGEVDGAIPDSAADWVRVDFGGYAFYYDPAVIEDVEPSSVYPSLGGMAQVPHPAYIKYALPLDSGGISVVEVGAYLPMYQPVAEMYAELENLINSQNPEGLNCVPQMPLSSAYTQCSHQEFFANLAFVDFANGRGVRFITNYAIQDYAEVSNENLLYVYQGITDDGVCYVTASFHLTHADIQDYAEIPDEVYKDSTGQAADQYFDGFRQTLDANPGGYIPSLERFDTIIQSIRVAACAGG